MSDPRADTPSADFSEINVERINVRDADGTLRMAISNRTRAPDPKIGARTGAREGGNSAGIYFYNDQGDECGGLIFRGKRDEQGRYRAGAALLFDRFEQDQTIGMAYSETDGELSAKFSVWDRPSVALADLLDRYTELEAMPDGDKRRHLIDEMRQGGLLGTTRLTMGLERDGDAAVVLYDAMQRERLRIVVGRDGRPRIEFLDEHAEVVDTYPPEKSTR
ncbi:MAG TPA: hypothetical protein VEP48_03300 [Methylomirabilota bacterium]|nr:hypothetical protein [Methylomirabilota bacterium]